MTNAPPPPESGQAPAPATATLHRSRIAETRIAAALAGLVFLFLQSSWGTGGAIPVALKWAGYPALIVCVLGRTWCAAYIGGLKGRTIVDRGPYSATRNPLYVFSFIGLAGIGLSSGMVSATIALALAFALYYRMIVAREESFLKERLGTLYEDYYAKVPRWIPDFSLWREADQPMGMPRNVYLAARDSAAFFIAPPLFMAIGTLQDAGMLPVLLRLP